MWRLALAGLRANRRRFLLAALATVVGTAFVAGTLGLSDTMRTNTERTIIGNSSQFDAVAITGNQLEKFGPGTVEKLSRLPGIERTEGLLRGEISILNDKGRVSRESPFALSVTSRMRIIKGTAPSDTEIVLAEQTARSLGREVGDTITVLDRGRGEPHRLRVSGLINVTGEGMHALRGAVGLTPTSMTALTGQSEFVELYVKAKPGVSPPEAVRLLRQAVGEGPYEFLTGREHAERQAASSGIDPTTLRYGLLMFALVALIVAAFVIYNTFNILITQRTRELALLRCIGTHRGQLFSGVLTESLVIGVIASLVGLLLGVGCAYGLIPLLNVFGAAAIPLDAFTINAGTVVSSLLCGLLTTVVAAVMPARAATRVAPMAALRTSPESGDDQVSRVRVISAGLLMVAGVGLAVAGPLSSAKTTPLLLTAVGGVLCFIGVVVLGPVLVRTLVGVLGLPVRRSMGIPGNIAVANARRNPKRAAVTVMALTIGVALSTGVSTITESLKTSADRGVGTAIPVDFIISPPGMDITSTLPRSIAHELRRRSEITRVASVRESSVTVAGRTAMLSTVEGDAEPVVLQGRLAGMSAGQLALRPERAEELGVGLGGEVRLTVNGRPVTATVTALVAGKTFPRMYVAPGWFDELFPDRGDTSVLVNVAEELTPERADSLIDSALNATPTARVVRAQDAKDSLTRTLNQVTMLITAMLGMAVVISLVGITNTMTLSVLERSRESALLRALGMTRENLRLMLAAEALMFGVIGGVIGVVLGGAFGLAAAKVINENIVPTVPYWQIIVIVVVSGLAGVLASLGPARRAARVSIVNSLAAG